MARETRTGEPREDLRDLGFGARVAELSRARLLNKDGSFNVTRRGLHWKRALSLYHEVMTMSWPRFYALLGLGYLLTNLAFAGAYLACGPGSLAGGAPDSDLAGHAVDSFFFSVQTLATIGYGRLTPASIPANLLVAVEALVGLLGFAMATSLAFARLSRPQAKVRFSTRAVLAPHRGGRALMFRLVNERNSQLLDLRARVIFSHVVEAGGRRTRRFEPLPLERSDVMFLPLHWTLVHAIDESSPLRGLSAEELRRREVEVLVLLTGIDETFTQSVYARSSYRWDEVVVGARFADMFDQSDDQLLSVDLARLSDVEPAELP